MNRFRLSPGFFLVLLAVLIGFFAERPAAGTSETVQRFSRPLPPPIEEPTGALLSAYEAAAPATVRIERRCLTRSGEPGTSIGQGTGFFVTETGGLVSAYHVFDTTSTTGLCRDAYYAVLHDGERLPVDLVGFDAYLDLAYAKVNVSAPVPTLSFADKLPRVNEPLVAIGNSRDDFNGARAGRVTRLGVSAGRADFADNTIELSNSLAPGDSGGPVLNRNGEVVGVVSYISYAPGALTSSVPLPPFLRGVALHQTYASYAVPLQVHAGLLDSLMAGASRDVPVIGFSWQEGLDYDPRTSETYLGERRGPIVHSVQAGGPADVAGLRSFVHERVVNDDGSVRMNIEADVIVAINNVPTPTFYDLMAVVRQFDIGETIELTVQREKATFRIPLTLAARRAVFDAR